MDSNRRQIALKRWRLLGKMLQKGRCNVDSADADISVRRFASFGLLKTEIVPQDNESYIDGERHLWYKYTSPLFDDYSVEIRHLDGTIKIKDLLGFNNTGNVCVWPAEEVLTYHALLNRDIFKNKNILEIGGGMTCLAGIAMAIYTEASEIVLTDGNEESAKNVDVILAKNKPRFGDTLTSARALLWDEYDKLGSLKGHFDMIVMADCLFFDEYRDDLVKILDALLKPKGEVLSFAPQRNETLKQFTELAEDRFTIELYEKYDDMVWNMHEENLKKGIEEYDANIHYPKLLKMFKKS